MRALLKLLKAGLRVGCKKLGERSCWSTQCQLVTLPSKWLQGTGLCRMAPGLLPKC